MATSYRKTLILVVDDAILYPSNLIYPSDDIFPGARNITNIVVGSLKLDEILAESPIQFGQMYSTKFEVQVYLEEDLSGKWIQVYQYNGNSIYTEIFSGKIDSCKLDKVGTDRTIIAYDKAYTFGQINIAQWWNTWWDNRQSATLKQVREAMLTEFGIAFDTTKSLINDSLVVTNTAAFDGCSLTDMLRMMCELSACFPHIGRGGVLEYITFAPNATAKDLTDKYEWMNSDFEDFETDYVTGVQFYDSGNELKWTVGTTTNAYPIQKNIFLYFADTATLNTVGTNIYNAIRTIKYTPASLKMIAGDFDIKLGDYVSTAHGNFYVLENSYSGSQLWEQTIKAPGDQKQYDGTPTFDYGEIVLNEKIARVNFSIEGLETEFTTKMTGLFANYKEDYVPAPNVNTSTANEPAATWISQGTQSSHLDEVFYYKNSAGSYGIYYRWDKVDTNTYRWNQVATSLDAFTVLSSTFKQTAEEISTEVSRATSAEGSLSTRITQNANAIELKVNKTDIVGELNSRLRLTTDYIELYSDGKIIIHGTNFSVDSNGYITANGATLNGTFDCNSNSARLHLDGGDVDFYAGSGNNEYQIGKICARSTTYQYIIIEGDSNSSASGNEINLEEEISIDEEIVIDDETVTETMMRVCSDGSIIIATDDLGATTSISSGCYIVLNGNSNSVSSETIVMKSDKLAINASSNISISGDEFTVDADIIHLGSHISGTSTLSTVNIASSGLSCYGDLFVEGNLTFNGDAEFIREAVFRGGIVGQLGNSGITRNVTVDGKTLRFEDGLLVSVT